MELPDLSAVEGFDWDDGNSGKSLRKHGVAKAEAEQVFVSRLLMLEDVRHSAVEPRFHALGRSFTGRELQVTFTLRGGGKLIRVISARPMNRKERKLYEEAQA
jgi:uncharacterized DUF497 family protein